MSPVSPVSGSLTRSPSKEAPAQLLPSLWHECFPTQRLRCWLEGSEYILTNSLCAETQRTYHGSLSIFALSLLSYLSKCCVPTQDLPQSQEWRTLFLLMHQKLQDILTQQDFCNNHGPDLSLRLAELLELTDYLVGKLSPGKMTGFW